MEDKTIYNCHAHIFTIDHVPNEFARTFIPKWLAKILTIRFVKWYYNNLTERGSYRFRRFIHRINKIRYGIIKILKLTIILYWIFSFLIFIFSWIFKIVTNLIRVNFLFDKELKLLIGRFMTLGRYSMRYKSQSSIYNLLEKTYAKGTKIVVLPMDMDYMEAGKPKITYLQQLFDLKKVSTNNKDMLPFIFLDPRRVINKRPVIDNVNYQEYLISELKRKSYYGIKMYPALGYFPFDKNLIDSFLFAQANEIPIITHCIEGTVFYRGKKLQEWNHHPILEYKKNGEIKEKIPLPQSKNYEWTKNFTHPMNYECLLNKELLSNHLGYECDLSKLKICLAHFGGSEEWYKYEQDGWNNYNKNISHAFREDYGRVKNTLNHKSKRTIWWNASWLSIIYDLMVKYENVYTDISFILFNEDLFPMLKYILLDEKVNNKILYGTDYYVVTQKMTEKSLHNNLRSYIGEELFFKIANKNPKRFLSSKICTI